VEASPYDRIWGIGLGAEDPKAKHPSTWQGENLLGFALMDAREAIRNIYPIFSDQKRVIDPKTS
jgi:ribA/ribD-fused uncharacterized protein